jgi:hypothetical protein
MIGVSANNGAGFGDSYSVAQPAVGTLGTLLATIPANPRRALVEVQNQSASPLTVVMDEGDEIAVRTYLLTGVGADEQGADWATSLFTGRIRIYGPSAGLRFLAVEF